MLLSRTTFLLKLLLFLTINGFAFSRNDLAIWNSNENLENRVVENINDLTEKGFIENKGQMRDGMGNLIPNVLFKTESPNFNIWITSKGITFQTLKYESNKEFKQVSTTMDRELWLWERVDLDLVGARIKKENIIVQNPLQGHINYVGEGIYGMLEYKKITIKEVYSGIDWVFYRKKDGTFKYEFVVHENGNYKQIKLLLKSKSPINLNSKGEMEYTTIYGDFKEEKPISFYGEKEIKTEFNKISQKKKIIEGDVGYETLISFNIERIPKKLSGDLIVDPSLVWATYIGGSGLDGMNWIETDLNNIYVAGYNSSPNFPSLNPGGGAYFQGTIVSGTASVFIKFDNNGTRLWSTYITQGGTGINVRPKSLCTDVNGNLFFLGQFSGSAFTLGLNPGGGAYFQTTNPTPGGGIHLFVMKFDVNGVLQWSTNYGGDRVDEGADIYTDTQGDVYITGSTNSTNFPVQQKTGAYFSAYVPGNNFGFQSEKDAFIIQFDNNGVLKWATCIGGTEDEISSSITVDPDRTIYIGGRTQSTNFPLANPGGGAYSQPAFAGGTSDLFIAKFDSNGVYNWGTYYGGSNVFLPNTSHGERIGAIRTDSKKNVYITGDTEANNFPLLNMGGNSFHQGIYGGDQMDVYLLKFDSLGVRKWATYIGGSGQETVGVQSLEIDRCDNIIIDMASSSPNLPIMQCDGGHFSSISGNSDHYLVKFNYEGAMNWATYFGGSTGSEAGNAIAIDSMNNLFVSGEWNNGWNFPLTNPGAGAYFDNTPNGDDDGFVAKFTPISPTYLQIQTDDTTCLCLGSATIDILNGCAPYSFNWSNGVSVIDTIGATHTLTGLCAGNYWVEIISNCNLTDTLFYTIEGSQTPCNLMVSSANKTICEGDCVEIIASTFGNSGPVVYQWDNGIIDIDSTITVCPQVTTIYTVVAIDSLGNSDTLSITVSVLPPVDIDLGVDTIVCTTLFVLDAKNPGATYVWNDSSSSQTLSVTSSGTYWVTVDNGGCVDTSSIGVTMANVQVDLGEDIITCEPSNILLDASSSTLGGTYLWNNGSTNSTISVSDTGTYNVQVIGVGNCIGFDTIIISMDQIVVDLGLDTVLCEKGTVELDAGNVGATYLWSDGSTNQTLNASTAGNYSVIASLGLCQANDSIIVDYQNFEVYFVSNDTAGCVPFSVDFTDLSIVTSGTINSWVWDFGDATTVSTNQSPFHTYQNEGVYDVKLSITSNLGCQADTTMTAYINTYPYATAAINYSGVKLAGEPIQFSNLSTNAIGWLWNFGDGFKSSEKNPSHTYGKAGNYNVSLIALSNNELCNDTTHYSLSIENEIVLFVPNAFTPYESGANQTWKFYVSGIDPYDFSVYIYNRWGEIIWESNNPFASWDGVYNGKLVQDGIYIWKIECGEKHTAARQTFHGYITVLK